MKKGSIFSILIVIVLITISFTGCFSDEGTNDESGNKEIELEFLISSSYSSYTKKDPIIMNFTLLNKGLRTINLSEFQIENPGSLELFLIASNGTLYKEINDPTGNYSRSSNGTVTSPDGVSVSPNEYLSLNSDISNIYWMKNNTYLNSQILKEQIGYFSLYAIYTSYKFNVPVWVGSLKSDIIEFEINS